MTRCTKCVLPSSYPTVQFDEAGVCNYCLNHRVTSPKGKDRLGDILASSRTKAREHDCLVGVSGGKDSSYALYYLVRVCGLRVLACAVDNGFMSEAAKSNLERAAGALGVELVVEKCDYVRKYIKHSLPLWLRHPSPAMINVVCVGCNVSILRGLLGCAKRRGIPLVVLANGSPVERAVAFGGTADFRRAFLSTNPLGKAFARLGRPFGRSTGLSLLFGVLNEIIRNPFYLLDACAVGAFVREYLFTFHVEAIRKLLYSGQRIVRLYDYIDWEEGEIFSTIKTQLNWESDSATSSSHFDCGVYSLKSHLLRETVGFTDKDGILSVMIREGMITREDALERLRRESRVPRELITELLNTIGVDERCLSEALRRSKRTASEC